VWRYWWAFLSYDGKAGNPCYPNGMVFMNKRPWGRAVDNYTYVCVLFITPLILLIILNFGVVFSLITSNGKNEFSLSSKKRQVAQRKLSLMATCLISLFFICETPACIDRIMRLAGYQLTTFDPIRKSGLFLIVIDSSLNFFVYIATNEKFREVFRRHKI
jgi:hypothetical protein